MSKPRFDIVLKCKDCIRSCRIPKSISGIGTDKWTCNSMDDKHINDGHSIPDWCPLPTNEELESKFDGYDVLGLSGTR